jgi:branched-chain amino acid transport system substrate-binding protein
MARKNLMAAAAICVAMMGSLVACGHDDGSGGASAIAGSTDLKGDPIVVGSICSCSGAQSAVMGKISEANEAWAAHVNADGGINGHPVKIIVKDDAGDPAKGLQAAKELIEGNRVMAIVGTVSVTTQAWADYVSQKGVPVVGGFPGEAPFASNPDFFPSGSSLPVVTFGQMAMAKEAGKTHLGLLYCAESPICAQLDPIVKGLANAVGGMKVTSGKVAGTAPNYTAPCVSLKEAGVDAIFVAHNAVVVDRVISDCGQQDFHPLNVPSITTVGISSLKNPSFEGSLVASPNALFTDDSIPAVKTFRETVEKFSPGVIDTPQFNTTLLFAWAGGELFEKAALAANLTPTSTPEDVKRGLYALKDETLDGLAPLLNFTEGKPAFPSCYFTATMTGGEFEPQNGGKATCLNEQELGAVTAALKG